MLIENNDHNSGRLIYTNNMLYYTIGDQATYNSCEPNLAQILPTQEDINSENWTNYPGKILRLNIDGSIPDGNPILNGVKSHIYSYGHRNNQGIVLGSNGLLYSDEHGQNTDDEVNIIYGGKNYGWSFVAGYKDNQRYNYCDWSSASNCGSTSGACPSEILFEEQDFSASNFREPLLSMFAAPNDYDFNKPICINTWMCRPNVASSSLGIYENNAIPSWKNSL